MKKLIFFIFLFLNILSFTLEGKVISVMDGDTIIIQKGLKRHKIRFYGVDAPEP